MSDVFALDATAQAELIRSGQLSPAELVELAIARIERYNPELNAVVTPLFAKARAAAAGPLPDGPFRGVPILLKDLGPFSEGDPMYGGMKLLKQKGFVTPFDSFLTRKLRQAGFVIVGKSSAPEMGILPTTEAIAFGPTRNPYDLDRTTGGSSGGSAAAVAAGLVAIGHANDGGGSIRIPAACCGLVGLKPTRGRISLGPIMSEVNGGIVVEGGVTRSVRDTAALLDVLAGEMPGDPYHAPPPARPFAAEVGAAPGKLRIGFATRFLAPDGSVREAHPDCVAAVQHTARLLTSLGHEVREAPITALEDPEYVTRFMAVWAAGIAAGLDDLGRLFQHRPTADDVEPLTWALYEMGKTISASDYLAAWGWLRLNARAVARYFKDHDLYLSPTTAEPPPPLGTFTAPPGNPIGAIYRAAEFAPFAAPFNATGQPAISLPLHATASGLPIGIQLAAPYGDEARLLRIAAQLEAAQPFTHRATRP